MNSHLRSSVVSLSVMTIGLVATAAVISGCGSGSSASSSSSTPMPSAIARAGARRFRNRTPNPAIETSVAQGTPFPFGNRTPRPEEQTAISEGTPAGRFRGPVGGFGQSLGAASSILSITPEELRSELQAPGATLANVAAAHGQQRAAFRQALIDATKARLAAAVAANMLTQDQATQAQTMFESNLDRLLDSPGGGFGTADATPAPGQ